MRIPKTHMHIFDAVEMVGRHLFGDEWTGREREVSDETKERYQLPKKTDVITVSDEEFELRWHTDDQYRARLFDYHKYEGKRLVRVQDTPPTIKIDDARLSELEAAASSNKERRAAALEEMAQLLYADSDMIEFRKEDGGLVRGLSYEFWLGPAADEILRTERNDTQRSSVTTGLQSHTFPLIEKAKLEAILTPSQPEIAERINQAPQQTAHEKPTGNADRQSKRGRTKGKDDIEILRFAKFARLIRQDDNLDTWAVTTAIEWLDEQNELESSADYSLVIDIDGDIPREKAVERMRKPVGQWLKERQLKVGKKSD